MWGTEKFLWKLDHRNIAEDKESYPESRSDTAAACKLHPRGVANGKVLLEVHALTELKLGA